MQVDRSKRPWPMNQEPGVLIAGLAIATAVTLSGRGLPPIYFGDIVALALICLFIWWCYRPSRSRDDAAAHEESGNGFALRLGKSFKRIWRTKGGLARSTRSNNPL
jgi:hypothetical protein